MKGNEKNILIGAVVLALLLVAAAWKFFYSEDLEKADQVQGEINTLQVRMEELNKKNANRSMYEAGITNSDDIINTILSLYGPGNTPEKTIMLIVDMCKKTGCSISDIGFQESRLIYASETKDEGETPKVQIFKSGMSLNILSGYTQLKKITDYINSYPERMNAENFSVAFDSETGLLSTTMQVNMYSVTDENHTYVAPVIEDIELGSDNIFRTFEHTEEEEGEETGEIQSGAAESETSTE